MITDACRLAEAPESHELSVKRARERANSQHQKALAQPAVETAAAAATTNGDVTMANGEQA